jgi:hypothetical protein
MRLCDKRVNGEASAIILEMKGLALLLALLLPTATPLKPGSQLPNLLVGSSLRNAPVDAPAPRGWVVYVARPDCRACEKTLGEAAGLASSLSPEWAFLVAVPGKPEEVEPFLAGHRLTLPVVTQIQAPTLAAYRISREPAVYVLDRDWRLVEVKTGPLDHRRALALASRLKVDLKALAASPKPATTRPGSLCLDQRQAPYSRGAKADALGLRFRCGPGGIWTYIP